MRGTTVVAYLCKEQIRERRIYGREYKTLFVPSAGMTAWRHGFNYCPVSQL